ncbi:MULTISPECIES: Na/Pi cotransporter family protein [Pseudobutyrivibrio]|jgi:phosphate:Na+ symporter|uniref:Na/Pi cotransporter family protein n=2 Tax=Pseudobutyrivibrio TaxID=46205 RepID=A0A2G3DXC4_9FIRM|nr:MULTISPECIES: Na/Pi cotransporter family protein [Pseudobutyrivibrio]MBE5902959.1 Na/Pi cotransporter family protein [Pseudobutyrivibrio sp.]NEX02463.1 Na/Pi cotransporter family protein [Pseudobutyrivibrio xylanivorans]PHU35611.1 Na/Pi cotransporter family protein [Pseudobutyrivibrio ruminis]PHU41100.1 Na/Pi cotransporter family protein [Pseudobutyrivibrio ruminis]SCX92343.1 phosphate:Na+ symporter [Pseudobutyrivibrio sp. AR14]
MTIAQFLSLLGGVGLFLFGMSIMSTGLKNSCGDNLQIILEKATTNKLVAVLVGIAMTVLVQSSSATDVMVIGFVNSGMMALSQAIGVILGANIGTTITAQITAFNIATFTPFLLFIGAVMYLFIKNNLTKHIGSVIMGFGMLFQGITIMKTAIAPLSQSALFVNFLTTLKNPFLALLFGIAFTALLQSSSSSTVIFQAFVVQGILDYDVAVYLVIGAAIGSVTPNLLASLTANRNGKRSAILNLLFNVIRALVIIVVINVTPLLSWIQSTSADPGRQIANTHTIFALIAVCIIFPFTDYIIKLTYMFIPELPEETRAAEDRQLVFMSQVTNVPPHMAIHQAQLEAARMGAIAAENFEKAIDCFFDYSPEKVEDVEEREETVNILNHAIQDAMVKLQALNLTPENLRKISAITIAVTDMERISDHAENIIEYATRMKNKKTKLSKKAAKELKDMAENSMEEVELALEIFTSENYESLPKIEKLEAKVDKQEKQLINHHVERLMDNKCEPIAGVIFSDMVTDLERCADHAINIAYALKDH